MSGRKSKMRDSMIPEEEEEKSLPQVLLDKIPYLIKNDFNIRFADKKERQNILNETLNLVKELHTIYIKKYSHVFVLIMTYLMFIKTHILKKNKQNLNLF